jgi:DNA repair protein RecO (recombination protein O)
MRVNLQPAYILHRRPYLDSSLILEALTAQYGRISLVAKGARRKSRGGSGGALLQPFTPLLLSFSGRSEMKNLNALEAAGQVLTLRAERLYSGLYLNELLVRLLHRHDPHPQIFAAYGAALDTLCGPDPVDVLLRRFEFALLDELGYGFDLRIDGRSGEPVVAQDWYHYDPDCGLFAHTGVSEPGRQGYAGADLLAMSRGDFDGTARLTAKRLLRQALACHLGDAPLRSRELFRASAEGGGRSMSGRTDASCSSDTPMAWTRSGEQQ